MRTSDPLLGLFFVAACSPSVGSPPVAPEESPPEGFASGEPEPPPPEPELDAELVTAAEYGRCVEAGACSRVDAAEQPLRVRHGEAHRYCQSIGKHLPSAVRISMGLEHGTLASTGELEWGQYRGSPWVASYKRDSGIPEWEKEYAAQVREAAQHPDVVYAIRCQAGGRCRTERVDDLESTRLSFRCATGELTRRALRIQLEESINERLASEDDAREKAWVRKQLEDLDQIVEFIAGRLRVERDAVHRKPG
jgi:hypothetical protein